MRCEEVMKRSVECIAVQDTVQAVARKMRDANIGFLPVCAEDGKVIGTLTDRDIVVRACADDCVPSQTQVGTVMSREELVSCRPEDDVARAHELMREHQKSRMLCVDEEGKLAGVISLSDLAQHHVEVSAHTLSAVAAREANPQG